MTEERLKEIEERAAAATEGPWQSLWAPKGSGSDSWVEQVPDDDAEDWPQICDALNWDYYRPDLPRRDYGNREANMAFIAHAREDVPDLLAEVRRLRAEIERIREGVKHLCGLRPLTEKEKQWARELDLTGVEAALQSEQD